MVNFTDTIDVGKVRKRSDGSLVADCRVARTGVQHYLGMEIGVDDAPTKVFRIYRDPSEVFAKDTMASFAHKPVTNDHPPELVSADNWKQHAVGNTGDEVSQDGKFLRVPLMVSDGDAIRQVENGKAELSAGYTCDLDWTAGTTADGEEYDARQVEISANHIAVVQRGRAGKECRIGDDGQNWGATPITNQDGVIQMTLKTIMVDGVPVEVSDQAAAFIDKLQKSVSSKDALLSKQADEHKAALDAKQADVDAKDAEIDDLKGKVLDDDAVAKLVSDTMAVLVDAKKIAGDDFEPSKLTADTIRRDAVVKVRGDTVQDQSQAYIDAAFDILLSDAGKKDGGSKDPVKTALGDRSQTKTEDGDGQSAYEKRLQDAWKGE